VLIQAKLCFACAGMLADFGLILGTKNLEML
jgi:hypothetical protein